jgi:hypothetical protein
MSGSQKLIVVAVTLFIALSRMSAVSKSMWEWDEALFSSGVREYDVTQHHPHPPGYPLHMAAAKLVRLVVDDDFRAVQAVVIFASMFLFPALFFLCRRLGFGFTTSLCGAALYCFLPNVWYYGGTAFSDVPATMLAMVACTLLLRGADDRRFYVAGSILLAVSIGFRPQNLLIGLVPGIIATWKWGRKSIAVVLLAAIAGIAIVLASYGGAALASDSPAGYVASVKAQQDYVSRVDSFRNPGRPPLLSMAKLFFFKMVDHGRLMAILFGLTAFGGLAALVRRRAPALMMMAMFGPFALFAWLMLDPGAVSRYSVGYLPLYGVLAADTLGAGFVAAGARPDDWRRRIRPAVQVALVLLLTSAFVRWTLPALRVVRENDAPNVAAVKWARSQVDPARTLYVFAGLGPFADYYLADRKLVYFENASEVGMAPDAGDSFLLGADRRIDDPLIEWRYTRGHLWKLARQRYFEAEVVRLSSRPEFHDGWYQEEGAGADSFRWMGRRSRLTLPEIRGTGALRMVFDVPLDVIPAPTIVISWNGAEVDRFVASASPVTRALTLPSTKGQPNELVIATTEVARAHGDPRDLGLCMRGLSWNPVR